MVEHLDDLGFGSVKLYETVGGPPPQQSPRPFKKVLNWLLGQLAKIGRFMLNAVAFMTTRLNEFGLSAVAINIALPAGFSVELPINLFRDAAMWPRAKRFLDGFLDETSRQVFVP